MVFICDILQAPKYLSRRDAKRICATKSSRLQIFTPFYFEKMFVFVIVLYVLDLFVFVIYLVCFGLHFLSLFTLGANKKRKKVPKKEKNQRNHLEFARISRLKICTTRAQISSLKIQQFYAHDKQLRCTMRFMRIQASGL